MLTNSDAEEGLPHVKVMKAYLQRAKEVLNEATYNSLPHIGAGLVIMIKIKLEIILRIMMEIRIMVILVIMEIMNGKEEKAMPAILGLDSKGTIIFMTQGIIIIIKRVIHIKEIFQIAPIMLFHLQKSRHIEQHCHVAMCQFQE